MKNFLCIASYAACWLPKRVLTCTYKQYWSKRTCVSDSKLPTVCLSEFSLVHIKSISKIYLVYWILSYLGVT